MHRTILIVVLALLPSCRGKSEEAPAPVRATAAVDGNPTGSISLDQALSQLEQEIDLAIKLEGIARARHMARAEAITDRLLETQLPFAWLGSRSYGVEPLVRQIQALADRVMAELKSPVRPDVIVQDMTDLLAIVRDLRTGLAAGGGQQPIELDSLLAQHEADTLAVEVQVGGGE